jgi:hypothetical protein
MSSAGEPDWKALRQRHPEELVDRLLGEWSEPGTLRLTAGELAAPTRSNAAAAAPLLNELAADGFFVVETVRFCGTCEEPLGDGEADRCPRCQSPLTEPESIRSETQYVRRGERSRDVEWVLALHGMNTRGAWQEDLNWRVSRTYGRMVPVAIYKYGIVRPGVLLRRRQRRLTCRLGERLRVLSGQTAAAGFGSSPDVVAHSFGTWLIGHALASDATLKVGRVVLTGSILRPDFPWRQLAARGQVEVVLNHYGTRDFWAAIAHYLIPDSGPSGRRGFDGDFVVNVPARGFSHGRFFAEAELPRVFEEVWKPFLTLPAGQLETVLKPLPPARRWRQAWWPLRATLPRYAVLLLAGALLLFCVAAFARGWLDVVEWLRTRGVG